MLVIGRNDGESIFFNLFDRESVSVRLRVRCTPDGVSLFESRKKVCFLEFEQDEEHLLIFDQIVTIVFVRRKGDYAASIGIDTPRSIRISRDNHVPA
jgi:sRNA-binding carbon storage regulator CsrA